MALPVRRRGPPCRRGGFFFAYTAGVGSGSNRIPNKPIHITLGEKKLFLPFGEVCIVTSNIC